MKTIFLILITVFFFVSCTREVTLDFRDYKTDVVVNSLLVPDSTITVRLSESLRSDKEEIFPLVNDAAVEITNGSTIAKLTYAGNGVYTNSSRPIPGNEYQLKVVTKQGKVISSITRIPLQPDIKITPLTRENLVKITISDNPGEKNYYWIGQKIFIILSNRMEYETYISSDFLLFDDFNRTNGENINGNMSYSCHFFARLEDAVFNGKEISLRLQHKWPESNQNFNIYYVAYLYIINADQNLDQYLKAALIQYDLKTIGDMPVFYNPVNMYSNISNGKGIFGSYTISQFDITIP